MQIEALGNLENLRKYKNKALIISATGTENLFISIRCKSFNTKKLLFVVHRLTIAKDSLKTFQKFWEK
jgi:superfamily II DNA or RNA helicase